MGIFKKIRAFLHRSTDNNLRNTNRRDEIDRLNDIPPLTEATLLEWIETLNVEQLSAIDACVSVLDQDREMEECLQILAIVKHLFERDPGLPMTQYFTKAIIALQPLSARLACYDTPQWTELELDRWIDSLDDHYQPQVLDKLRQYRAAGLPGGPKLVEFLCGVRRSVERCQQQDAEDGGGGLNLLHAWYIWQEERRKNAQQEYFERENRNARGG